MTVPWLAQQEEQQTVVEDIDIHIQTNSYQDLHVRAQSIRHSITTGDAASSDLRTSEVPTRERSHGMKKTSIANHDEQWDKTTKV